MLENKLHEELMRHKAINKYGSTMIMEQDAPLEEPAAEPAVPTDAPADPAMEMPADPALDASLPPADGAMGDVPAPPAPGEDMEAPAEPGMEDDSTEEIDITDLVNLKNPRTNEFKRKTNTKTCRFTESAAFEKKEYIVGLAGISLGINR